MFDAVKAAGLNPADLAAALGINRVTASMWLNDHCKPHRLLGDKVSIFLDAVNAAVEAGELPVPAGSTRAERRELVERAVISRMTVKPN